MVDNHRKHVMRRIAGMLVFVIVFLYFSVGASPASCTQVVLVTGFEPFANYTVNPSELIAEVLNGTSLGGATVVGVVLPVDFNNSVEMTIHVIEQYHPVLVIITGLNARSHTIKVEKIGMNLKRYPNNDGTWSFPRRIDKTGPFFRITLLHTNDIVRKIRDANISVQQSIFAGTYVCNTLFYQMLGYANDQNRTIKAGFIHVPLLDSQDPQGMSLQTMVDAVKIAIQTSLE
jgi:pyroglutamyl-peptidase